MGRRGGWSGRGAIVVVAALVSGLVTAAPAVGVTAPLAQTRTVAPAVDGSASVEAVSSAQKDNAATASLSTTTPGDLIVAFVGSDSPPSGGQSSVVSGGGLTWTKAGSENASLGDAEVWTAHATTALSGAQITAKQKIQGWDEALTVVAFANAAGVGATTVKTAPKGAPSATVTTTAANSWVWASGDDWLKSIDRTPAAGQTIVHSATDKVGDTYWVQSTTAPTPATGTAVTINDTAPTGDPFNLVLVEILGNQVVVPTVTGVIPASGPVAGHNAVTVTGTSLLNASEVDFGSVRVTSGISVAPDGSSVTVAAPPGTGVGAVDVRVTTPAGQTAIVPADQYTYTAPTPSPYHGAKLTLSPGTAGPNAPHTSQTLTATLTDAGGKPLGGMAIGFAVTGANPTSTSVAANAQGVATFTYTGANAGTDTVTATLRAGSDSVSSNPATVSWVVPTTPVATVSMDPVQGQFFAEPTSATTFVAKPTDTPVFAQTFPDIAFNPPAGVVAGDHYPPAPTTHPLTDVTTDVTGAADGTIPAAGNGQQAGIGSLAAFDAVLTTTLHVTQPGDLSYAVDAADGFLMGVGNNASRVSGDYVNPPASQQSVFDTLPLVAVANQPSGGTVVTHPVTIHFPTAGDYPVEIDYFSTAGPDLALVLRPSTAVASVPNTPPVNVYVGYQDTLRAANDFTISPLPWFGSPGVTFEGDSSAQGSGADAGGIRFDNVTSAPVTIDHVTVDIPVPNNGTPAHFDQWPTGMVIPPGQTLILTENAGFASFDTSDVDSGTCGIVQPLVPAINVTIGGVTSVYRDSGEVLNTGGFDQACIGNESEPWARVGTTGPANPVLPPPRVAPASAWDEAAQAFVVFGGYDASDAGIYRNDTWVWQKGKWTDVSTPTSPPARAYAGGAYDRVHHTFVVFGGYNTQTGTNYDDTWTFDGTTWTQQHPAHAPPALNEASDRMAYDDATGTIVLVTSDALGSQHPDTWTWDGTDWTEHASATQPTARWAPALGYDQDTTSLLLFGGSAGYNGTDLNDTWQWDGSNWTQASPAAAPPARAAATMDYDSAAHGMLLFGSDHGGTDTWLYANGTWTQQNPTQTPSGRGYAASAYDPVDSAEIVAFGGQGGSVSQPLADLWLFNGGNWSTTLPSAAGPVLPPATSVELSPGMAQSYPAGLAHTFTVSVVGPVGQPLANVPVQVQVGGANATSANLTTNGAGTATFTDPGTVPGVDRIQAVASVTGQSVASNQVAVTWTGSPAGPPPALGPSQPADGAVVRAPMPVTAAITPPAGQTIASWSVQLQPSAPGAPPVDLASGTGAPPSPLATLDPTTLVNGQYDLVVVATASGGGMETETSSVSVAGPMKLGAYQATYHELTVPVDGVPMTVDRVYNSLDHGTGDFGTGWHVAIANFRVGSGRALGIGGWQQYPTSCGLLGCSFAYATPTVSHAVTVTWPDGHQEVFDLTPTGGSFGGLLFISPGYTARPGTNTVDTLTSGGSLAFGDDGNLYNSTFAQASDGTPYNPTQFTLTTPDGTAYLLDTTSGLVSETTAAHTSITVDGNGVHGSNGESITFARDAAHDNRITSITGPGQNQQWTYGYDGNGELASVTDPVTTVHYAYDPTSGELLRSTDADNQPLTTITYGPDGRVTSVAQGANPPTLVTSSAADRSQTTTDPNGHVVTTQLFDTSGDLVEQDRAAGSRTLKTTYTYDPTGRLTSTTDPLGHTTATTFDETPGSATEGDVLSQTDADGDTWTYGAYSVGGQAGTTIGPDGTVMDAKTFDPVLGQPTTDDVPGLAPTTYAYNPNGTIAAITDPSGAKVAYTYDGNGNIATEADAAGDTITTIADATGQPTKVTDAAGHEIDYAYDGNGNITSAGTPGTSSTKQATYNGFGEPLTATDPDGHTTTYTYDNAGNTHTRTDPDGVTTTYAYDADGNLTTETTPTGTTHYTYDTLGNLVEADNAARELNATYDDAGQLLTQTSCAPQSGSQNCPAGSPTVTHTIDPAGFVTATTTPAGRTAYTYNADGSLATATDPGGHPYVFGYDPQGRQTSLTRPNGTVDTATFNDADQPLSRTTTGPGGAVLARATNTIDQHTGQITQMTDLAGTNTYTYNPDGTLASATHPAGTGPAAENYTYDAAGNRFTNSTSTYDAADHLLSDGTNTYTWTGAGNLATATNTATNVKTSYTWSADGQLLQAADTTGLNVTNTYDPLGRLASETANGTTTTFQWDDQTLLSETTGSSTTSMTTAPTAGLGSVADESGTPADVLSVTTGTTTVTPLANLHGDWTAAADATGKLSQSPVEYSAFGTPTASNGLPAGFDGYQSLAGGLDYGYGRIYDPSLGIFLSPDPMSGPNPYTYAGSNPVTFTDPSGLEDAPEEAETEAPIAANAARGQTTETVVYKGVEPDGRCYVGITRNLIRRQGQHGARFPGGLQQVTVVSKWSDGRRVEQLVINKYGLGGKVGQTGQLTNKINSIKGGALYNLGVADVLPFLDVSTVLAAFADCP